MKIFENFYGLKIRILAKMHQRKFIRYVDDMPSYPGPSHWCISCGHKLTSEVYVSCLICKKIDLCLSCYCRGVDVYPHFKDHPVSVIIPSIQPGFELGWTLREELIFIESLSKEYAFNWENVSNEIRTKDSEECRHHFLRCFIKAINAPDPRGGSSFSYLNSNKSNFCESNEILKIKKKEIIDSDTTMDSDIGPLSAPPEKVTFSPINFPSRFSPKLSAISSSSNLYQQQQTIDTTNSPNIPISTSSIFDDDDDTIQFNRFFKKRKNRPANCVTNGDAYGFSLGRKEFEPDPYDAPEMTTLNLKFDENETEESFIEKLEILQAYDSVIKDRSSCDSSLFKLKSFTDFMSQPTIINSNNASANKGQNFNISRSRRNLAARRKGISEPSYRPSKAIPISKFSTIEAANFGLIEVAEDPNEIEEISSIIHDTNSFLNSTHISQNNGGTPAGTSLQAALFQHLSHISFLDEIAKKDEKDEETKEIEDQSTEKEEEIADENFKSDDNFKRDIETEETEEKIKKKTKQEIEIEQTNEESKNLFFGKKQTKKKNVSASPKKSDNKEKKLCGSITLNVNLSEKDLRQWNDSAPLAESAHLFDSFYCKFMSKNEINFIKEKKISASLFTKVKSSIIPMIIGNFNKEMILQKVSELYPNFYIEASMITDYFYDSNLYNCVKTNGKPK